MSKLYDLLNSIISKVRANEKAIPTKMSQLDQDVGVTLSVNDVKPDEKGNVAIDIPKGFSGSWNDLTDKPFGESDDTIKPIDEKYIPDSVKTKVLPVVTADDNGAILRVVDGVWMVVNSTEVVNASEVEF